MTAIPWVDLGPVLAQVLFQVLCGKAVLGLIRRIDRQLGSLAEQFIITFTLQRAKSMHELRYCHAA